MGNEKYMQFVASFLIILVLTLPFYTTSVYATINKITVKGSDGIEGYAKANDFMNINVQASISNETIKNEQVILGSDIKFDKCTGSINNGSECTLRFPSNGTESFEVKSVPFTVNLFKGDKTLDDSKSGIVTVDNKVPQVKLGISQSKFSLQNDIVVNYEVTDFACDDPSCNSKCVGIKNIEFFVKNGSFNQKVDVTSSGCTYSSNLSIAPTAFNDGKNSVFAKAVDKFNQVSAETSVTFTVDAVPPSIITNSFAIMKKGISLNSYSTNKVPVDVVINISANDFNPNSVIADLSSLNPSQNLKNAKASCAAAQDNLYACKWPVELNPKTGNLNNIVVNASDNSGNRVSAVITKVLSLDDKGPAVQTLSIPTTKGSQSLAKSSGNAVTAVFEEATGLSAEDVFLHVGNSKVNAKSCSKEILNWVCAWENVNFESSSQMSIEADTTDVLGNAVAVLSTLGVTVDKNAPVLKGMNVTNIGGLIQAIPGFFKIGDKIAVVANVTEDNDVFAIADFSKFISGAKIAGSCQRLQADEHICVWETGAINLEASDVITFNFSDNAGNSLIIQKQLRTFGLENATVPDFWDNTVTCSPKAIDRQLGPLINQRTFCQVQLRQKSATKPVSTVFIGQATCTGDSAGIVQNVETFNTEAGSTTPIIKITLKKDDFKINNASLSCTLNIFSRIGSTTTITKNPEIENVQVNLEFFNLPLGELDKDVKRQIKEAKESAEGIFKLIGTLNKLMFYAKKVCQIIHTIYNIVAVLYSIANILGIIDASTQKINFLGIITITPTAIAACGAETKSRVLVAQPTKFILNRFCDYVTCKQTILWGPAVQNFINNEIPLAKYIGTPTTVEGGEIKKLDISKKAVSDYMDPQRNLGVAALFACIPGVIYGLDKLRQINCLYADCLQNAVGREGLPLSACDRQKSYATCKYVTSELSAIIPYTAIFDHFMGLVKNSLSNPFAALGIAVTIGCSQVCPIPNAEARMVAWHACETARLLNQIGDAAQNVKNIINEGFKIRQDYCSRLKDIEEEKPKEEQKPTEEKPTKK